MINSKYRLLVLMDLSKASEIALKNAIHLAKTIQGRVEVLYVKAPADVVKYENQYSAIRTIHEDYQSSKSRLIRIVRNKERQNNIKIKYRIAYGNIKNAIKEHISNTKPDLVLLGKRKSDILMDFFRQGVTEFVLEKCSANVLIVGEDHKFHSYTDVIMGVYEEVLQKKGFEIVNDLSKQNRKPIKFFTIRNSKGIKRSTTPQSNREKDVSYVFSEGINALDNLASYVSRTNTQLFCIPKRSGMHRLLQKLDIPILILN